jgi:hypothetical protein
VRGSEVCWQLAVCLHGVDGYAGSVGMLQACVISTASSQQD